MADMIAPVAVPPDGEDMPTSAAALEITLQPVRRTTWLLQLAAALRGRTLVRRMRSARKRLS